MLSFSVPYRLSAAVLSTLTSLGRVFFPPAWPWLWITIKVARLFSAFRWREASSHRLVEWPAVLLLHSSQWLCGNQPWTRANCDNNVIFLKCALLSSGERSQGCCHVERSFRGTIWLRNSQFVANKQDDYSRLFFSLSEFSPIAPADNDAERLSAYDPGAHRHGRFQQRQLVEQQQLHRLRGWNIEETAKRNFITHFIISRCRVIVPVCSSKSNVEERKATMSVSWEVYFDYGVFIVVGLLAVFFLI